MAVLHRNALSVLVKVQRNQATALFHSLNQKQFSRYMFFTIDFILIDFFFTVISKPYVLFLKCILHTNLTIFIDHSIVFGYFHYLRFDYQ